MVRYVDVPCPVCGKGCKGFGELRAHLKMGHALADGKARIMAREAVEELRREWARKCAWGRKGAKGG